MKRERVSGSRYIHPALVEHTTSLAQALRHLGERRATVFLAVVLYNASPELIGKRLQMHPVRVRQTFSRAASALRHPSNAIQLHHLAYEIGAFDASALVDDELRALIREWRLEEVFEPLCGGCTPPHTRAGGQHSARPVGAAAPVLLQRLPAEGLPGAAQAMSHRGSERRPRSGPGGSGPSGPCGRSPSRGALSLQRRTASRPTQRG
ncbi:hypothetical protein [Streptomyces mutabilis]|uniref:hypothetical protein n=1 Tax=Streptomyces mutabilis TaxID=67332 RepID=UPI0034E0201E